MIDNWTNQPQGWVCPKCGRVYSPITAMCFYCGQETKQIGTGTGTNPKTWTTGKLVTLVEGSDLEVKQ